MKQGILKDYGIETHIEKGFEQRNSVTVVLLADMQGEDEILHLMPVCTCTEHETVINMLDDANISQPSITNKRKLNITVLIHLPPGTYVRTTSIDKLVLDFINTHLETSLSTTISSSPLSKVQPTGPSTPPTTTQLHKRRKVQIISLGAGTDTRFFRLLQHHPFLANHLVYHEIDFPAKTKQKIQALKRAGRAREVLDRSVREERLDGSREHDVDIRPEEREGNWQESEDGANLSSSVYNIHALDLRDLVRESSSSRADIDNTNTGANNTTTRSTTAPNFPNLNSNTPTLLLSECCLTYLPTTTSTSILKHFATTLLPSPTPVEIILYEPLHPSDAFGKIMSENLRARGIRMPGLTGLEDVQAHGRRLADVFTSQHPVTEQARESGAEVKSGRCDIGFRAWTIKQIWDEQVSVQEKERLRACEMVDEEEEWNLLAGHYGVLRGWRS